MNPIAHRSKLLARDAGAEAPEFHPFARTTPDPELPLRRPDRGVGRVDNARWLSRAPWITLALVALSVLLDLDPATWQIDRVAAGEPWRWATGHLVHWNPSHRLWDVAVVLVFGVALERTSRRTLGEVVLAAMLASSAMFAAMYDDLDTYRGLSGVACGLVAACGMTSLRRGDRVAGTALLLGLFGKIAVESLATGPMFAGGGFMNVPGVHLAGALSGVLAVAWRRATRRTRG